MFEIFAIKETTTKLLIIFSVFACVKVNAQDYSLFQTIQHKQLEASPYFSTDGNRLLITEGGKAVIYILEGEEYIPLQAFSLGFTIEDAAWSDDLKMLAIRYFSNLRVFTQSQGKYQSLQQIAMDDLVPKDRMGLKFCQNKSFLISPENSNILIYKYSAENKNYQLHQTLKAGRYPKVSIAKDCSKILQSNNKETIIHYLNEGKFNKSYSIAKSKQKEGLKVSSDGAFAALASSDSIQIWSETSGKFVLHDYLSVDLEKCRIKIDDSLNVIVVAVNSSFTIYDKQNSTFTIMLKQKLLNHKQEIYPNIDITANGHKIAISYQTYQNFSKTIIFSKPVTIIVPKSHKNYFFPIIVFIFCSSIVFLLVNWKLRKAIIKNKVQEIHEISHEDDDKMCIHK